MAIRASDRPAHEMRPVKITPGFIAMAEGSALIEVGHTRVICTATVEESVPSFLRNSGRGWVTAEYSMLPRATLTRTPRESAKGRVGGRTHEIQRLIGRSLRAVVEMRSLGERTITVDCDVIQADGGTRTASITGAMVALGIAVKKLLAAGAIKKDPLRDLVAATSVGIVGGEVFLDLDYSEDSRADVDMNIVLTSAGKFVELQATAEQHPFDDEQLALLMKYGRQGCERLIAEQQRAINA